MSKIIKIKFNSHLIHHIIIRMKIYSPPDNHVLAKILFAARISRKSLILQPVPYGYKHKQFQQQHSLFTIPALQIEPHNYVFGSHSILRVLEPTDHVLTPFQQAQVNQWFQLIEREFEPSVGVLILKTNELTQVKQDQINKAKEVVLRVAKQIDERLKVNSFLVGDSISIADISAYFSWNEVRGLLEKESKALTNLHRWAKHISSIPTH